MRFKKEQPLSNKYLWALHGHWFVTKQAKFKSTWQTEPKGNGPSVMKSFSAVACIEAPPAWGPLEQGARCFRETLLQWCIHMLINWNKAHKPCLAPEPSLGQPSPQKPALEQNAWHGWGYEENATVFTAASFRTTLRNKPLEAVKNNPLPW